MKSILIATPLYPPDIGGPAQYAQHLEEEFVQQGYRVHILKYGWERWLPTGLRHSFFFCRALLSLCGVGWVLALDTFSVGWPVVIAAKLLRKKVIMRIGGDFLWETYVERTGDVVILREFYLKIKTGQIRLSTKEYFIAKLTKWTLREASMIIFSTKWQQEIWQEFYCLNNTKVHIVENYIGDKLPSEPPVKKNFIASGRQAKLKNLTLLKKIISDLQAQGLDVTLDLQPRSHQEFMGRLQSCYGVIVASFSDISPNVALDALRFNKPLILTQETGLRERLAKAVQWIDPKDEQKIAEKIIWLADSGNYQQACQQAAGFTFSRPWSQVAGDILALANTL